MGTAGMPASKRYLPHMLRTTALCAAVLCAAANAAPPHVPPAPPADIDALRAAATTDEATARRQLTEAGVDAAKRKEAAAFLAKAKGTTVPMAVLAAIEDCAGACGATRDLADLLESLANEAAADAAFTAHAAADATDAAKPGAVRIAAYRVLAAVPAASRPEAAKAFAVHAVAVKTIPGAMQYDVKEIRAKPNELLELVLENTDTMQHNLLVVAPGKMSEVGVAADKMGETPAGKAAQFVPDLPSVIAVMGLVDPGKSGRMFIVAPAKPGNYQYVCTYPGHWRMMNGKLKVAE